MPAQPILFLSHVVELGGAENVLLDLLEHLDRDRFAPHLALPTEGPLSARAEAVGAPVHHVPLGGSSPWQKVRAVLRARPALRNLAAALGCRLLVANSMIAGYAGVLARHRGLACVWHLHIVTSHRIARAALRRADTVIAPSARALAAARVDGEVIQNGIPDRFFSPTDDGLRQRLAIPPDERLVGIVGRIDPRKGHEVLLRAIADWPSDAGAPPHIAVAGGELFTASQARMRGERDRLRELADQLGIAARVHWLGELADTAPLLAELDALVVPSTGIEATPRTIAEAHAAGVPVVASDIGGIGDMLDGGASGGLVPPGDPRQLALALRVALCDSDWRARSTRLGRERAEGDYRMASFARRCEGVFAATLAKVGGPATIARSRS